MKPARFYQTEGETIRCLLCPQRCHIAPEHTGLCRSRRHQDGVLYAESYGRISGLAVDPIEKKPLYHFYPGSQILSAGSFGCNLRCAFCQNSAISQENPPTRYISPQEMLELAKSVPHNLGVAFTYNEPLIAIEYLLDTAPLLHEAGFKVVLVTNGVVAAEPLEQLLPFVDAMNIDVKGFSEAYYQQLGGSLAWVKQTVERAVSCCHLEIITLVVPGENDSDAEIDELTSWLASLSPEIPLHLSRFFPRYLMRDKQATPVATLERLAEIARRRLKYVHLGNV